MAIGNAAAASAASGSMGGGKHSKVGVVCLTIVALVSGAFCIIHGGVRLSALANRDPVVEFVRTECKIVSVANRSKANVDVAPVIKHCSKVAVSAREVCCDQKGSTCCPEYEYTYSIAVAASTGGTGVATMMETIARPGSKFEDKKACAKSWDDKHEATCWLPDPAKLSDLKSLAADYDLDHCGTAKNPQCILWSDPGTAKKDRAGAVWGQIVGGILLLFALLLAWAACYKYQVALNKQTPRPNPLAVVSVAKYHRRKEALVEKEASIADLEAELKKKDEELEIARAIQAHFSPEELAGAEDQARRVTAKQALDEKQTVDRHKMTTRIENHLLETQ